jgi:hypothetical protein
VQNVNHTPSVFNLNLSSVHTDHTAEAFNNYFLNLADSLKMDDVNTGLAISLLKGFLNDYSDKIVIPNTESGFICTTACIKNKNASRYDDVTNNILRSRGKFLSKPLTYTCKLSLMHSIFPDRLKYSIVSPLFKKGDRSQLSTYWPTLLLTSFSKIFDILIYQRLNQHMQIHNILVPEQFGLEVVCQLVTPYTN